MTTMRQSPRRPLILRRRKLPFQQNDPPTAESQSQLVASGSKEPTGSASSHSFPDGIRIVDHPFMSDTQVVVIPKAADLQSVIGALTAKGKESGAQGPNKYILLSGNGETGSLRQSAAEEGGSSSRNAVGQIVKTETIHPLDNKPLTATKPLSKNLDCRPLDESLTNIQCPRGIGTRASEPEPAKQMSSKEKQKTDLQAKNVQVNAENIEQPQAEKPPYSYMALIKFAINSKKNKQMTLKEIYTWIEDRFPYFKNVAKPGWKNSIRHNLSLHDMFIREMSSDGKISFWTIRPEANQCLTLDEMRKPEWDPTVPVPVHMLFLSQQQQNRVYPDQRTASTGSGKRMKPLLPRTDCYFVPIQLPFTSSVYLPSPETQFAPSSSQQKTSRGAKKVRIAPKVTQGDVPAVLINALESKDVKVEVKEEPVSIPIKCETPKSLPKRQARKSRRKQHLVHSRQEEPVLVCSENTLFDSGVASDASTFQEIRDTELPKNYSPNREFSFKTPVKSSSSHLISSTPSKPASNVSHEPWKVTPVGKGSQNVLDCSPIRTPSGPVVTPQRDYTNFSFSSTPFKDLQLFNSPRELQTSAPLRASSAATTDSPARCLRSRCSRELLQTGGTTPTNQSLTEGLMLDLMNDSLSKILVDISFSTLDDEDLGMDNISWSELIPQFKSAEK